MKKYNIEASIDCLGEFSACPVLDISESDSGEWVKAEDVNLLNNELILSKLKIKQIECKHCGGSGWDPYPNHSTTIPPCPDCQF